jgi:hypothetical protein
MLLLLMWKLFLIKVIVANFYSSDLYSRQIIVQEIHLTV